MVCEKSGKLSEKLQIYQQKKKKSYESLVVFLPKGN